MEVIDSPIGSYMEIQLKAEPQLLNAERNLPAFTVQNNMYM